MSAAPATVKSDAVVRGSASDIPGLMEQTTMMLDNHPHIYAKVQCVGQDEIDKVKSALHLRFDNSGEGVVARQPPQPGDDDECVTFLITRAENEPTVRGTAKDIPALLDETTETVEDKHYAYVIVDCANGEEMKAVQRALERRFASSGRGVVERRPTTTATGDCACTTFLVNHTDIGSDSENDGVIDYDYKYDK